MELVLIIGAIAIIAALIALCTFWFFNLHRGYLVLEEKYLVQMTTAEDDYSPSVPTKVEDAEEDRGKKLFLATSNWGRNRSLSSSATKDGKNGPVGLTQTKAANGGTDQARDEERVSLEEIQESDVENPSVTEKVQNRADEGEDKAGKLEVAVEKSRLGAEKEAPDLHSDEIKQRPAPAIQTEIKVKVEEEKKN